MGDENVVEIEDVGWEKIVEKATSLGSGITGYE